ncbi:MAG: DNA methyltransferase [Syntrophus sp. (in: bacteria)]
MNSYVRLKTKLAELFQLDQADLDFGIYRIMNAKQDDIIRFLEKELLPKIQMAFQQYKTSDKTEIKKEIDESVKNAVVLGLDPDIVPKIKELRDRYNSSVVDLTAIENEVYDHLYSFFSRYYDEGDFISLRRYREGVYAIPYEGEEVKLYWANHDQYYIKTTEYFRDYSFKLTDGRRVHFKISTADTEKNNVKAASGKDRSFILREDSSVVEENGDLIVRFEYRADTEKRKQEDINRDTVNAILMSEGIDPLWLTAFKHTWRRADGTMSDKNILEKHLYDYTKRNTFDYFIHKDLGKFLRRELDFYIKNEVMHLDDVENETVPRVEQYLSKIKSIRMIARKIIDFLAQIEDFQKRLWMKKKFIIETNYCLTLDRIPEELYPEIARNVAQREEWIRLFAIDEINDDLTGQVAFSTPLTVKFLKANNKLVLDTKFFAEAFKSRLIASIDNFDEQCGGLIIHSENFQALNLLQERYREQVKCIYIDPPYNAKSSEILYKNSYKNSSWLSLMYERLRLGKRCLQKDFTQIIAIDEIEQEVLGQIICQAFPNCCKVCVPILHNPRGQQGKNVSYVHDFAYFVYPGDERKYIADVKRSEIDSRNLRDSGTESNRTDAKTCFYPFIIKDNKIINIGEVPEEGFHPSAANIERADGSIEIWPMDESGNEKKWRYSVHTVNNILEKIEIKRGRNSQQVIFNKDTGVMRTVWADPKYDASEYGTKVLQAILGEEATSLFSYPKSIYTVRDSIYAGFNECREGIALDYFGGSGTTAHAVIDLNREDGGTRKYILVEMGDYFDTVLKPRIQKVVYAKDWKDGKPVSRHTGVSHMFKYLRLESYEDALANLQLQRTPAQQSLLDQSDSFRESYMLSYMLDMETKDSPSLLNIDRFDDPFSYRLLVGTGSVGETTPVNVDLVETFNWLLGLKVKHINHIEGFRIIEGTNPKDEKVLVIWRKIRELTETDAIKIQAARQKANEDLEIFFRKQQFNTMDMEFDVIYVNGDNNLMNLPMAPEGEGLEPRYKVRLIEEEFKRLMFDVRDV